MAVVGYDTREGIGYGISVPHECSPSVSPTFWTQNKHLSEDNLN